MLSLLSETVKIWLNLLILRQFYTIFISELMAIWIYILTIFYKTPLLSYPETAHHHFQIIKRCVFIYSKVIYIMKRIELDLLFIALACHPLILLSSLLLYTIFRPQNNNTNRDYLGIFHHDNFLHRLVIEFLFRSQIIHFSPISLFTLNVLLYFYNLSSAINLRSNFKFSFLKNSANSFFRFCNSKYFSVRAWYVFVCTTINQWFNINLIIPLTRLDPLLAPSLAHFSWSPLPLPYFYTYSILQVNGFIHYW